MAVSKITCTQCDCKPGAFIQVGRKLLYQLVAKDPFSYFPVKRSLVEVLLRHRLF